MKSKNIADTLGQFNHLPKFPDGRIDYSNSDIAPVVTVFVKFEDKILLLKRSEKVRTYQGLWNTVAGYIDEDKPIDEIAKKELREELGISRDQIESIKFSESFEINDQEIDKKWIVYPVIIIMKEMPNIVLDWEHSDFAWVRPEEVDNYRTVYMLKSSLEIVLKV